jgi:hypothetical protein
MRCIACGGTTRPCRSPVFSVMPSCGRPVMIPTNASCLVKTRRCQKRRLLWCQCARPLQYSGIYARSPKASWGWRFAKCRASGRDSNALSDGPRSRFGRQRPGVLSRWNLTPSLSIWPAPGTRAALSLLSALPLHLLLSSSDALYGVWYGHDPNKRRNRRHNAGVRFSAPQLHVPVLS